MDITASDTSASVAIERQEGEGRWFRLPEVEPFAEDILLCLSRVKRVNQVVLGGSYRRRKETLRGLDILATCENACPLMDRFTGHDEVAEVVLRGKTHCAVLLRNGLRVDLRVFPEDAFGAALFHSTGTPGHVASVREMAVGNRLAIRESGVFREGGRVGGRTEEEVYRAAGLPYIPPELREDQGEIEAAASGSLPELITLEDIRGDLHGHTTATDGRSTLEEMAAAARALGYEYLAITDHSVYSMGAGGMDETRLRRQMERIDRLNETFTGFRLLKGLEVDIREDGSLDTSDAVLAELDIVVCSLHAHLDLPEAKQTRRVIHAMDNPYFNIYAHPTARLAGYYDPIEIDLEHVMEAALARGCFLELNSKPERLDLSDVYCKLAKEMGLKVAISTDAHRTDRLQSIRFGIEQARRGWLEPDDVLNTRSWLELKQLLKRRPPA